MTAPVFSPFGKAFAGWRAVHLLLAIVWVLAVLPTGGEAAEAADPERRAQAREILDLMRQDRRDEALPRCREYNQRFPGDPVMLYNQACLESTAGLADAAAASFTRAVEAGFDDFARAFSDPDLAGLRHHPDLVRLAVEHQVRMGQAAAARAIDLAWQEPSAALSLLGADPEPGAPTADLVLTWTAAGLAVELHATGPWADLASPDALAPWNGGPGLVVTLGLPPAGAADPVFQIDNHFVFAFGTENDLPVGALYLAGPNRWQAVSELQPKIRLDAGGRLELDTLIPWAAVLPYDPVVDPRMGLNAALRVPGPEGDLQAGLLPDPAAFRPRAATRRIVPLTFRPASLTSEVFAGKISRTISGADPLTLDLTAVAEQAGTGRLTLDFLGGPDQSLLPDGQVSGPVDLTVGLNHFTRQADFSGLKTGAYVVKAQLEFPSGRVETWGATVLQLAADWQATFTDRVTGLTPQERPTAQHHLAAIEEAVAAHPARRGPGAIVTALDELGRLLDRADRNGTIMPDQGNFLVIYPGPDGSPRRCHLYLPAGWKIAKQRNPVLTLTVATAMTGAIADRTGQNYEQGAVKRTLKAGPDEGFPVYLVPSLSGADRPRAGDLLADLPAEAEACLDWARATFAVDEVSLAGVDAGTAAAFHIAGDRPTDLKALIVFAGAGLDPWPQADAAFIRDRLGGFPTDLPVTWVDFVSETRRSGQGPAILQALQDLGGHVVDVQTVRGGLNFTQVADRTVQWAEGLR